MTQQRFFVNPDNEAAYKLGYTDGLSDGKALGYRDGYDTAVHEIAHLRHAHKQIADERMKLKQERRELMDERRGRRKEKKQLVALRKYLDKKLMEETDGQ